MTAGEHRMRLLPCGDCATLVELPPDAGVLEFRADVAALGLAGVGELVPAARTLLVHHAARSGPVVRAALITLPLRERDAMAKTAPIEVSVRYDGADLAAVADEIGCSVETVIAQHQEPTYAVAFCGFAPGFAYLSGLPTALHLPRLATPRIRVPAGSVAIAGEYSAIYPRESPGGWRLLGRTEAILWDADLDPPAVLTPGRAVRFVAA
jgi:KipI family sensor histidine kinase inhibitor